jgi:cobalamin synthase
MTYVPSVPHHQGLAKDVGEQTGWRELAIGSVLTTPATAALIVMRPIVGISGFIAVAVVTLAWGCYVRRRIGGVTGDCLGCACYLAQCVFLLSASVGVGR